MFFYNKRFHLRNLSAAYGWKQWIKSVNSSHANTIYGIKFIWCIHEYFRYFKLFVNFHQSSSSRAFKKIVYLYLRKRLISQKYSSVPNYKKFLQVRTKYPMFLFNCRSQKNDRFWNFLQKYWSLQLAYSFKLYLKNKNFTTLKLNNWLQLKRALLSWLRIKNLFRIKKPSFYVNKSKNVRMFWKTQVKKNDLVTNAYNIALHKIEKSAKLKWYIYSFTIAPTMRWNYFFRSYCWVLLNNKTNKFCSNKTIKITFVRIRAYLLKKMLQHFLLGLHTGSFTQVGNYLYFLKNLYKKLLQKIHTNYHSNVVFNNVLSRAWLKNQKVSLVSRVWKSKTKLYLPSMQRQLKKIIVTLQHYHIPVVLNFKVKSVYMNKKKLNFNSVVNLKSDNLIKKKIPRMLINAPEFFYRFFKKFKKFTKLTYKQMYKTKPEFTFYKSMQLKLSFPVKIEPKQILVKKKEKKNDLWRPGFEPNTEKKRERAYYPELKKLSEKNLNDSFDAIDPDRNEDEPNTKKKRERVCYPELKILNDSFDVIDPDSKEDFTDEPNTEKKPKRVYYPELKTLSDSFDVIKSDSKEDFADKPKEIPRWILFQQNLYYSTLYANDAFSSPVDMQQQLMIWLTDRFTWYGVTNPERQYHLLLAKNFYFIKFLSNVVRTTTFHTTDAKVTINKLTLYLTSLFKKWSPKKKQEKPKINFDIPDSVVILNKRIISIHLAYFLLLKSKKNNSLHSNWNIYSNYLFLTSKVKNSEWSKSTKLPCITPEFVYKFLRQQGFTNIEARQQLQKQLTYINLKFKKQTNSIWLWLRRKWMQTKKATTTFSIPKNMLQQKVNITTSKLKKKNLKNKLYLDKNITRMHKKKYFAQKGLAVYSFTKFNVCNNVNINWFYNQNLRRQWVPFIQSWKRELVEKKTIRTEPKEIVFTPINFSHTRVRRKRWKYIKKNLQIIEWFSKLSMYDKRLRYKRYRYRLKLFVRYKLKKKIYKFYYNFICYFLPNIVSSKHNKLTLMDLKFYSSLYLFHFKKKLNTKFRAKRVHKIMPSKFWLKRLARNLKIKVPYNNLWYYLVKRWFKKKFRSSTDFWFLWTLEKWMKKKFNTRVQMKVINSNLHLKMILPRFLMKQKWFFYKTKEINSAMINLNFFQQPQFFNVIAAENLVASNNYKFALAFIKSKLSFYRTQNLHSFYFTLAGKTLRQKRMRAKTYKYISERNINTDKYFRYTFSTCCVSTPKLGSFGLSFFYSYLKLFPNNEI